MVDLEVPDWRDETPSPPDGETLVVIDARLSDWRPAWDELAAAALTAEEQERAARFQFLDDVRRHLLGRLIVRTTVGRWTDRDPSSLAIEPGPYDKPDLADAPYEFNVSHGGDHVVAAFTADTSLGIDVEPRERQAGEGGLAESVLTEVEFDHWQRCPAARRARLFMHLWTAKESLIKATGEGLYRDPTTIECAFDDAGRVAGFRRLDATDTDIDVGEPAEWVPRPFDLDGDGVACVTCRGQMGGVRFCRYAPIRRGNHISRRHEAQTTSPPSSTSSKMST